MKDNSDLRIYRVADGRFIAEERRGFWIFEKWEAIDLRHPRYLWSPTDFFYSHCLGNRDQIIKAISERGYCMPYNIDLTNNA
jgi:hypothetical protein